jgi:hypothetical protein
MVERTVLGARLAARVLVLLLLGALGMGLLGACTELPGSLGASCLKNQDCQSGVCTALVCAPVPPYLDAQVPAPDASADATLDGTMPPPANDGSTDAPAEAPVGDETALPDVETPVDSGGPVDTGVDSPTQDAPDDAMHPDAGEPPTDATTDTDAHLDAGEAG